HVPNSEDYYIVYHRRPAGVKTRDHRETCIEKMTFNEEGLINPVEITTEGVEARTIQ
ncbi:MAG TPA: arabinan endo-1,5-alpha-L-arabinosidase, partial [Parabacteroides distasonis]|nr:arabinan endo-1,5-alpha-L-arabinosidase [Parabacteroides distasonis]